MSVIDEIHRQLFEYAIASDTKDWERLGRLFTHGKFFFAKEPGSEGVVEWGRRVVRDDVPTQHLISTVSIEIDQLDRERVTGRNYLTIITQDADGAVHTVAAVWFDSTWQLIDGAWRWKTHTVTPLFRGDSSLIHQAPAYEDAS